MSTGPASYNLPVNLIAYKANIKKLSERNVSRGASPIFRSSIQIDYSIAPASRPKDNPLSPGK